MLIETLNSMFGLANVKFAILEFKDVNVDHVLLNQRVLMSLSTE